MSSSGSLKRLHDGPADGPNKRHRPEGAACETEEPHECVVPHAAGKKKFYAIWGGPNPGIHFTVWDVAQKWTERYKVKQRSFKVASDALQYYREQKRTFPQLVDTPRHSHAAPQAPRGDNIESPQDIHENVPPHSRQVAAPSTAFESVTPGQDHKPNTPLKQRYQGESGLLRAAPSLPIPKEPPLSPEQARLVDIIVKERKNVFYTGSAGVGKSRVLKAFRQRLSALGYKVNVVAPTGRAALDINGSTTWSYAGWTPESMKKPLKHLQREAWKRKTKKRLQKTDVLVIDEISMVENFHLERLNWIMKEVRQNEKAFGGVQVVVTGDFCQLPPVNPFQFCIHCGKSLVEKSRKSAYECIECKQVYNDEDKWAFQSNVWKEANFEHINLETIFRQRDKAFIDILQKLRLGIPLLESERKLLCEEKPSIDNAVKLYPRRDDVKRINDAEFKKLRTTPRVYHCADHFKQQPHHHELSFYNNRAADGTLTKLAEHRYEPHLELKEGMLVVLLVNISIPDGLVNGSQGTVVGFKEFWDPEEEEKSEHEILADIMLNLDENYTDYRARQIFDFMKAAPRKQWPIVGFSHRGQYRELPITASCYPTELGDEPPLNPRYSLLSRTQIPLMAAWAMTIHKSQGMTLEKVEVDLSRNFEEGMAYVALSRATSLGGLRVISFPENAEMGCNEEVREFLDENFQRTR